MTFALFSLEKRRLRDLTTAYRFSREGSGGGAGHLLSLVTRKV